jgi:hypothetical protein
MDPGYEIYEALERAETILTEVTGERRRMARLVLVVTGGALIAAAGLLLNSLITDRLTAEARAFRQTIDEQGRKAAKARHPAGSGRARRGSGDGMAARPARPAEPVLPDEDLTTPEHELHREA